MNTLPYRIALGCTLMLTGMVGFSLPAAEPDKTPFGEAKKASEKWVANLAAGKGLVLDINEAKAGFVGRKIVGSKNVMYTYRKDGWAITLVFDKAIPADADLKTVEKSFQRIALDRVPTPGLKVQGWELTPRTPVSSFKKGITLIDFQDGVLTFRVHTYFFALYGRDPSIRVPADVGAPKGSYFQIRKRFALTSKIKAPLTMGK